MPASQILEKKRAGDNAERAETYLRSVVAGSAPADRSTGYLQNITATVEMLQRTTPIRLAWAKDYSDYHPEEPGGTAAGRTRQSSFTSPRLGISTSRVEPSSTSKPLRSSDTQAVLVLAR